MRAELLVVDNASTDATADVVHACRLPQMPTRYVLEPRRGKGYAYNTGMAQAQGDLFLFTDDDVRPPANWIAGMAAPLASGKAHALAGGVKLAPHLLREWMEPMHRAYLASTEILDPASPLYMVGANMAFSREVLSRVPAFDVELGPGAMGFGDDTLLTWQFREAGYTVSSAFDVAVEHHPDATRLRRSSWENMAVKQGRTAAYLDYHWQHENNSLGWNYILRKRVRRILNSLTPSHARRDSLTAEELFVVSQFAYSSQYRIEQKRPRNYARRGLVKQPHA